MFFSNKLLNKVPRNIILLIQIIIVPPAAHYFVTFKEHESFLTSLNSTSYWVAFSYTLILGYALVFGIGKVTLYMDNWLPWHTDFRQRFFKQLLYCFLIPLAAVIVLATCYFAAFGYNILNTYYFQDEIPMVISFITLVNGFYFILYVKFGLLNYLKPLRIPSTGVWAQKGTERVLILRKDIAFIEQENRINRVYTIDGCSYIAEREMQYMRNAVGEENFFMINRNQIINRNIILSFKRTKDSRLLLNLNIKLGSEMIVSRKRAFNFKVWIGYMEAEGESQFIHPALS